MKFCTKCGAELVDEAVICTKCGRMLETTSIEGTRINEHQNKNSLNSSIDTKPTTQLTVFSFLFRLSLFYALLSLLLGIGLGRVVYLSSSKPTAIRLDFLPDSELIVLGLIFSILTIAFGIVCFIMTLVEKHKGDRLFQGIIKPIVGISMFFASIIILINS